MPRGAVVVNPTKCEPSSTVRAELDGIFTAYGWEPPIWLETTAHDPGYGQARAAVDKGADLVCALGGDGTVRCVAAALARTGVPLGLLASGTGNLLARNLGLPYRRYADGLRVALSGRDRPVDVLRVGLDRDGDGTFEEPQTGLVMTGVHFDAEIMASTPEGLKKRLGWLAYPTAGLRHVAHGPVRMRVETDRGELVGPAPTTGVLVGNCGRLTGGITLMPGARIDDGVLDAVVVSVKHVAGWVPVVGRVLSGSQRSAKSLQRLTCGRLTVTCDEPVLVEVDGDVLGRARGIRVGVDPRALLIRTP